MEGTCVLGFGGGPFNKEFLLLVRKGTCTSQGWQRAGCRGRGRDAPVVLSSGFG